MHFLLQQVFRLLQQLTGENDRCGRPVTDLFVLRLRDLHHHLRCGVLNIHLLQDRRSIVRNDDITHGIDEHLVHSLGAERGPDGIGNRLRGKNVPALRVPSSCAFTPFSQNQNWCTT